MAPLVAALAAFFAMRSSRAAAISARYTRDAQRRSDEVLAKDGRTEMKITANALIREDGDRVIQLHVTNPVDSPEARNVKVTTNYDPDRTPGPLMSQHVLPAGHSLIEATGPFAPRQPVNTIVHLNQPHIREGVLTGDVTYDDEHGLRRWQQSFAVAEKATLSMTTEVTYEYYVSTQSYPGWEPDGPRPIGARVTAAFREFRRM